MPPSTRFGSPWLRGWRLVVVAFLLWTADGLLNFGYRYIDVYVRGSSQPAYHKLIEELTGAWGAGLLVPLVFWLARRLRRHPLPVALVAHVGGAIALSSLHTTWNWAARIAAFRLFGLGSYDYGIMRLRYFMELPNDVIWYAFFVVLALLFDHYRETRDRELQLAELETEMARMRVHALEARLQPHFLFNALNTISAVMYDDVDRADRMLSRLGELLRRSLRDNQGAEVPLTEELATLELYLDVVRERFGDRLSVTVEADAEARGAAVPPLVLQPLVENAVTHGDPGPGRAARIAVRATRQNGHLTLEVTDNGPGLATSADAALSSGIGLNTTRRRIERLYGNSGRIELQPTPGSDSGLCVRVVLPYRDLTA